jgi:HSP20 family protein
MARKEGPSPLLPERLETEVERLFEELIHRPWRKRSEVADTWSPQLDLYETPDAIMLEVDLPGVKQEDVSVTVEDGELILHGRRECERVMTHGNVYRHERHSGKFTRRLHLSTSVDKEHIRAEFHEGVLRVTLRKLPQEGKTRS